jgi:uncharacterized protein (DUF302 family)
MTFYSRKLKLPFEDVVQKITLSLQRQGFGVVTSIDMSDIFKKKLNVEFRPFKILGACNPQFAYRAVCLDPHIGLMLPCNVLVQQHENGEVEVSAVSPMESIDKKTASQQLLDIAAEVNDKLRTAVDDLDRLVPVPGHAEALPRVDQGNNPVIPNVG